MTSLENQSKEEKQVESKQEEQEKKQTLKDILTMLTTKIAELEQKLHQQERAINALTEIFKQYQQLIEQSTTKQSGGEGLSTLLPLIFKSFEGGGEDKFTKLFFIETLKTNLLLQRVMLQGLAKQLGIRLRLRSSKKKGEEE